MFVQRGYTAIDCLRLCPFARQFAMDDATPLRDISPAWYKLRKQVIRLLPQPICDTLARWNARRQSGVEAP